MHLRKPKSIYYPIKLRPFGKYWLPAPAKPYSVLEYTHLKNGSYLCESNSYNHIAEKPIGSMTVNCTELTNMYFFTETFCVEISGKELCFEKLRLNTKQTIFMTSYSGYQYAVTVGKSV